MTSLSQHPVRRRRTKPRLGWYVVKNGEQVAWSISKTIAKEKAKAIGGNIEREKP